jgi:hypothetical protein
MGVGCGGAEQGSMGVWKLDVLCCWGEVENRSGVLWPDGERRGYQVLAQVNRSKQLRILKGPVLVQVLLSSTMLIFGRGSQQPTVAYHY